MNETNHKYRGYEIIGTQYTSSGGYVLGGRHFVEGGIKRNYNIKLEGKYAYHPNAILETLRYAKEVVDRLIESK